MEMMMPWSMTYVATPIAVAVRGGCFTPCESRAIHLYICWLYFCTGILFCGLCMDGIILETAMV